MLAQPRRRLLEMLMVTAIALAALTGEAAHASGAPEKVVSPFVSLEPIIVPLLSAGRPQGFMIVEVIVDTPDGSMAGLVQHKMPRIRDAFIQTLTEYAWVEYRRGEIVRLDRMDRRLQIVLDWALGKPGARVLFKHIMIQN